MKAENGGRATFDLMHFTIEFLPRNAKQETGKFVTIFTEDSGEGISPENMKKLFQPLFTTKARGIGLGLVTCRNLIEINGGKIEVQSELGHGSTFSAILPVGRDKA